MGRLADIFRQGISMHMEHFRPCAPCKGTGWKPRSLRAPNGTVPIRAVVAKVQCSECSGKGKHLIGEQVTERGRTRAWEHGRLIDERAARGR